jgi:hypothetical protein
MDPTAVSKSTCSTADALSSHGSGRIESRQICNLKGCRGVVDYGVVESFPPRTRMGILRSMNGCGDACSQEACEEASPSSGGAAEELDVRNR